MDDSDYIVAKIGRLERMRDLVENGTVFMQRVREFREAKDAARRDVNEGAMLRIDARAPGTWINLNVGAKRIPLKSGSVRIHAPYQEHGVYCMYAMRVGPDGELPDDQWMPIGVHEGLRNFGDTLVVFNNAAGFVERLEAAAHDAGYELYHRRVEYVPDNHSGPMTPFHKLDSYSYQSEWRFLTTKPIPDKALILKLGNLRDLGVIAVDLNTAEAYFQEHPEHRPPM